MDKSAFKFGHESSKVFARTGAKQVKLFSEGTIRDQISVLFCRDATGKMMRPLVLYDSKLHLESMCEETTDSIHVAANESGMIDPVIFKSISSRKSFPNSFVRRYGVGILTI